MANEVEFFRDALKESGLDFFCTIARSTEQAFRMLKSSMPDVVFIDVNSLKEDDSVNIKQFKLTQSTPVVLYSGTTNLHSRKNLGLDYVQLPKSTSTMARVLKNLFIENSIVQ